MPNPQINRPSNLLVWASFGHKLVRRVGSQLYLEFGVDPDIQSVSREDVEVLDQ